MSGGPEQDLLVHAHGTQRSQAALAGVLDDVREVMRDRGSATDPRAVRKAIDDVMDST